MTYGSAEDRLNPVTPEGTDDSTIGGYAKVHGRSAAFEGADGEPYTVAVETEETGDVAEPWVAYLVFVRWAQTGSAIMGHLETGDLAAGETEADARAALEEMPLSEARAILDETIQARRRDAVEP